MKTTSGPVWEAFVRSDVYAGGHTEDGDRREELSFAVVCEDEQGRRFQSRACFTTEDLGREAAMSAVARFCQRVNCYLSKGSYSPETSPRWFPIQGCYGSAAWDETVELDSEARELGAEAGVEEENRFRRATGGAGRAALAASKDGER